MGVGVGAGVGAGVGMVAGVGTGAVRCGAVRYNKLLKK